MPEAAIPQFPGIARLRPWLRTLLLALVIAVSALVLWRVLEFVLGSHRGMDLTDEGLYFLAGDPPASNAAWGFPFGWHTHPLFALVGYDIANFRTLGAMILVLAAAWMGYLGSRLVTLGAPDQASKTRLWFSWICAVSGGVGSLVYYSAMLRTPSYNWLGLLGIGLASCGVFLAISGSHSHITAGRVRALLPAGLSSLALFLTLPAKPSILPMMLVLGGALIWVTVGLRSATRWLLAAVCMLPVWLVIVVVTGIWPREFASVLKLALQMPTPDPAQTVSVAVREALLAPRDALMGMANAADNPFLLVMISAALLLLPGVLRRRWLLMRCLGLGLAVISALAVAGVPIPRINSSGHAFGFAQAPVTTAMLIILLAGAASAWRLVPVSSQAADASLMGKRPVLGLLIAYLLACALVFAFGSDNGIYGQAGLAGGLILLAAVVAAGGRARSLSDLVPAVVVLCATIAFVAASLISGWRYPQRADALFSQTQATAVGDHGAELQLEPGLSEELNGLRTKAEAVGWKPGTPLVDVSYTWHPAVPYFLGARVPDSLQLTIFGYGAAHDITDFHLTEPYLGFPFADSWLLTTKDALLDPGAQSAVRFTMDKLSAVSGRKFPDSYSCVASGDFVLWRPMPAGTADPGHC